MSNKSARWSFGERLSVILFLVTFSFLMMLGTGHRCRAQEQTTSQAVQGEAVARMERMLLLNRSLDEANKLMAAGDLVKARFRYESVLDNTMSSGPTAEIHQAAGTGLSKISAMQAQEAEAAGNKERAITLWKEAITLAPENEEYVKRFEKMREEENRLKNEYAGNTAVNPELVDNVAQIQKLLFEGDKFFETGQYARAKARFDQVLKIDPYNRIAIKRNKRVEEAKMRGVSKRYLAQRRKVLANVTRTWSEKIEPSIDVPQTVSTDDFVVSDIMKLEKKLGEIRIPELNFTDVDVADAVNYLIDQSRQLDPDGQGVNIVLKAHPTVLKGATGDAAPSAPASLPGITLSLRDVPLQQVIEYIATLANLQYKVEEHAVFIYPIEETIEVLQVRSFSVPPTFFPAGLTPEKDRSGAITETKVAVGRIDVRKELEGRGVHFPSNGASAIYLPKSAKLVVRNTLEQLNLIEQLIDRESEVPLQVQIETKFVQYTEDRLKDISFTYALHSSSSLPIPGDPFFVNNLSKANPIQWIADPNSSNYVRPGTNTEPAEVTTDADWQFGTGGLRARAGLRNDGLDALLGKTLNQRSNGTFRISAIVADNGLQMLMNAVDSILGGDLLAAPTLTVMSGQRSKIRIARELLYPEEYDAPQPPPRVGNIRRGRVPEPGVPRSFTSRDIGVVLDVRATATPDRRIDLELKPEITDFDGFVNYGGNVTSADFNAIPIAETNGTTTFQLIPGDPSNPLVILEGVALQPIFSVRKVDTKVQVVDGQTVVMGGFIRNDVEEIEDKVPVLGDIPLLGRFFRSETSREIKKNLMIMVTARLIKPDGTPEFLTETERDAVEAMSDTSAKKPNG